MHGLRGGQQARQGGEDHQRHDARLQKRDIVGSRAISGQRHGLSKGDRRRFDMAFVQHAPACLLPCYLITGRVLN